MAYESSILKAIRTARSIGKERRKDRKRNRSLAREKISKAVGYTIGGVDCEIRLSLQEFLQEPILENIDLIVINCAENFDRMVRDVPHFQSRILKNLAFESKRPLLHIRNSKVGVDCPQRVVRIGKVVFPITYRDLKCRIWKRHACAG